MILTGFWIRSHPQNRIGLIVLELQRPADLIGDLPPTPDATRVSRWGNARGYDTPVLFLFPSDEMSDVGPGKKVDDNHHMVHALCGGTSSWGAGPAHSHSPSF